MPGKESFQVSSVRRIGNASEALQFLRRLEEQARWEHKYIVLDCTADMAKEIVVSHVRDITLGRRTYHYLLSGLVSKQCYWTILKNQISIYPTKGCSSDVQFLLEIVNQKFFYHNGCWLECGTLNAIYSTQLNQFLHSSRNTELYALLVDISPKIELP